MPPEDSAATADLVSRLTDVAALLRQQAAVIASSSQTSPTGAQALPQFESNPVEQLGGKSVKINATLAAGLVVLCSTSAVAEPLLRSAKPPPRPRGSIGRVDHPRRPMAQPQPAAAPADKPEQRPVATPAPANSNVVTISPSTATTAAGPTLTGSTREVHSFPPVQALEWGVPRFPPVQTLE